MDDFYPEKQKESRSEYIILIINTLTPFIVEGFTAILHESIKLCNANNESSKYLMTAQNFISRIPKWSNTIIETECERIKKKTTTWNYLEDLLSCVHIIQLKTMTLARVGQKQKQINIDIPKLDSFIHSVYIKVARKVYKQMFLFEVGIPALQIQKNNRDFESLVESCIMNAIRDNIPVATIMRAYLDEGTETIVMDDIKEEIVYEDIKPEETIEDVVPEDVKLPSDEEKIEQPPQNEHEHKQQNQEQDPVYNNVTQSEPSQVPFKVIDNTDHPAYMYEPELETKLEQVSDITHINEPISLKDSPATSTSVRFSESPDATQLSSIDYDGDDNDNDDNVLPKNFSMESILKSGSGVSLDSQSLDIGAVQL